MLTLSCAPTSPHTIFGSLATSQEVVMVGLSVLWLPILLSSVLVFVLSSVIHTVLPWHKSDYPKLPNEDRVRDALPAVRRKVQEGPGRDVHRVSGRLHVDGEEPGHVVPLFRCRGVLRGVRRGARAARRRGVPAGLPVRRGHRLRSVLGGALADVDLVPSLLAHDDQGDGRRADLRAPHGGHDGSAAVPVG